ncbi:MAG TPA: tetratricopeptide repeat protein, partial [Polyangiaceae bacterium]|nr:tetratricopeptide repeat protein [Polyangiaceae bacterium]
EPELAAELWVRFAKVLEQKLGNAREAVRGYQKACEQVGDRLDLLEQLDRLQSGLGETAEVIDLLERRRALADSDAEQSKLLTRQGQLQLDQQKRPDEAIASLRQALERDASNQEASALLAKLLEQKEYFDEVFDILDGVYRERREGQRLAELHGLRVARATTPSERIDMRRSLSRVLEEDCADPLAAVRALGEGLKDDASESGLLDEMERLLAITNTFSEGAATVLSAVQKTKDIDPSVARELCERAATWFRDRVGDPVATEAALSLGLEYAPDADELLEQLEQLQSGPGRENHLLGTLERRAELALDDGSRIEFLRRAKALADRLEQRERSEALLRRILQIDESDLEALESLTFLRRAAGDDAESFALLVRRTEVEVDGDKVRTLRFEAAELAQGKLGKLDDAIELFERLFEDEPDDARAAKSLLGAYEAAGRYEDVARVIERQMDGAADPALQRELKLALARLHEERFEDRAKAAELYEEITLDAPLDDTAGPALERLYSAAGQHDELARLLSRKSEALRDAGDASGSLALIERLAGLYEKELKQPGEAILAWESAFGQSGDVKALVALRRLHLAEGELPRAAEVIEQLAERSTGADAIAHRLELADLYGKMEDGERVTASLEAAVALAPSDAELRLRLRRDYESSERFDQVARLLVEDAGRAGSKGATVAILREAATLHLIKLEDPSGAADLLARASAATPEDRALSLELCDAYNAAGRSGEAIAVLVGIVDSYGGKRAKELLPIHTRLATAYLASGESARALEELDKAFRIEPGNVAVLKQLGELALETGDHKKAMQMFRALLLQKVEESNVITKAEVFFRVGQVHQALDEGPKAREWYEKAVKADPALDQARDALAAL